MEFHCLNCATSKSIAVTDYTCYIFIILLNNILFILYRHFRLDLRHNIPIISTSYSHLPSLARLYYMLLHIITGLICAIYVWIYTMYTHSWETTVSSRYTATSWVPGPKPLNYHYSRQVKYGLSMWDN